MLRSTARRPAARVRIARTAPEHAVSVARIVRRAHTVPEDDPDGGCFRPEDVLSHIERFPEGQYVALDGERVVGAATTMRTNHPPEAEPRRWLEMIGGLDLRAHEPDGRWLYGVEIVVDPDAQGRGVGSALYRRRKALVLELGLEGLYAGGMLKGYGRWRDRLTPREYGERVRRGELRDPTVTMQMNRGFEALGVIEDYDDDPPSGDCAMLIVWRPGAPRRPRRPRSVARLPEPPARRG